MNFFQLNISNSISKSMAIVFTNNSIAYLQSFDNASLFCLVISPDFLELLKNQTKSEVL